MVTGNVLAHELGRKRIRKQTSTHMNIAFGSLGPPRSCSSIGRTGYLTKRSYGTGDMLFPHGLS